MSLWTVVNSEVRVAACNKTCLGLTGDYRNCKRASLGVIMAVLKGVAFRESSNTATP